MFKFLATYALVYATLKPRHAYAQGTVQSCRGPQTLSTNHAAQMHVYMHAYVYSSDTHHMHANIIRYDQLVTLANRVLVPRHHQPIVLL